MHVRSYYALVKKSDLNSVKSEMLFHVLLLFHRLFIRYNVAIDLTLVFQSNGLRL